MNLLFFKVLGNLAFRFAEAEEVNDNGKGNYWPIQLSIQTVILRIKMTNCKSTYTKPLKLIFEIF